MNRRHLYLQNSLFTIMALIMCCGFVALAENVMASQSKTCVVIFEKDGYHPSLVIQDLVKSDEEVILKSEAVPMDLLGCLRDDVSQIDILAHTAQSAKKTKAGSDPDVDYAFDHSEFKETTNGVFVYFKKVIGLEREQELKAEKVMIDQEILRLTDRLKKISTSDSFLRGKLSDKLRQVKFYKEKLQALSESDPYYGPPIYSGQPHIMLENIWIHILKYIREKASAGKLSLKKIRFLTCQLESVHAAYPEISELQKYGVKIEASPTNKFYSWIVGEKVSTLDETWFTSKLHFVLDAP